MRRSIEKRLDALDIATGQNAPDRIIVHWIVSPGEAAQAKKDRDAFEPSVLMSSTKRWIREVGEAVEQFERRAFEEMAQPAKGARVLWAETNR